MEIKMNIILKLANGVLSIVANLHEVAEVRIRINNVSQTINYERR